MGYSKWHDLPRAGDSVHVSARETSQEQAIGRVLSVDKDCEEAMVYFFGGNPDFSQRGCVRLKGILYPDIICVTNPEMFNRGGEVESYSFDEFEGNWSSHETGEGRWEI